MELGTVRGEPGEAPEACTTSHAKRWSHRDWQARGVRPICFWRDLRWRSRTGALRRRRSSSGRRPASPAAMSRSRRFSAGGGSRPPPQSWCGITRPASQSRRVGSSLPARPVRWPCSPSASNVMAQAVVLGGDFGRAALLIGEADGVIEATGARRRAIRGLGARRSSRSPGRGLRPDRRHDPDSSPQEGREPRSNTPTGRGHCSLTVSAATRRRWRRPRLRATTRRSCSSSVWAAIELLEGATRSGRPEKATGRSSGSLRATSVAPTDWALGIQARCRALQSDGESPSASIARPSSG